MESYVDKSRVSIRPIYKPLAKDMIEKITIVVGCPLVDIL